MTMIGLPCLAVGFLMNLVAILFVLSALALIFIILLQRGKGGGLTAALGGGMASGLLGSKTGDVLTWVTISLVGVFLFLSVLMARFYRPTTAEYGTTPRPVTRQSAPVAGADQNAAAPAPAASTPATVPGPNTPAQ
jgi:preprotein translocase subunit SecG